MWRIVPVRCMAQGFFRKGSAEKRIGMKEKGGWKCLGGFLCLGVMLLLVQGMLFMSGESKETALRQGKELEESLSGDKAGKRKIAYLTFDDGPSVLTAEYLKILKEENVKATFFLIGQQVDGELVDVVRQEIEEGHEVGIHTYCHVAGEIYSSKETYCMDLQKTKLCLEEKLKIKPKFFRFPWGSVNSYVRGYRKGVIEQMKAEGIDYVDWNVSGEDSVGYPSVDSILANIRRDYKKYDDPVILLHDSAACTATLNALRSVIRELKAEGYSFATLSERKSPCHFGE